MTNKVIIDYTQCKYNTFDGGGSQRTICSLDGKYCDCLRDKECYYKQLQRKAQECEKLKEEIKQIKKNLRKRFSVQDVPDGDIIITCKNCLTVHSLNKYIKKEEE